MQHTKIEWADYVFNPIKGMCPEACFYCYGRRLYRRFKMDPKPRFDKGELMSPIYCHTRRPAGSRIFVCSTFEIFSPVADPWRDEIFKVIEFGTRDTFIILTKRPENIDRPMPPNVWLGVSVTCRADLWRIDALSRCQTAVPFVSFEPLLEPVIPPNGIFSGLKWAIFGKLTGHGRKNDPASNDLSLMISGARVFGVPIFMKENLRNIWSGSLIQEHPKE